MSEVEAYGLCPSLCHDIRKHKWAELDFRQAATIVLLTEEVEVTKKPLNNHSFKRDIRLIKEPSRIWKSVNSAAIAPNLTANCVMETCFHMYSFDMGKFILSK